MGSEFIVAVNKKGAIGRFSRRSWDLVKNKHGWIELGDTKKVEIPDEVVEIMNKKTVKEDVAVVETQKNITVTEISQQPKIQKPIPIEELELPEKELAKLMVKELREAGVKIHHATGYVNAKKIYDDYKEQ